MGLEKLVFTSLGYLTVFTHCLYGSNGFKGRKQEKHKLARSTSTYDIKMSYENLAFIIYLLLFIYGGITS